MFYSLLGRAVWFGLKVTLRHKYGPTYVPKPRRGRHGGLGVAVALAVLRARSSDA